MDFLLNPYFTALGVPFIFISFQALCKRLIDGTSFKRDHFYFGVELHLSTLTSSLIFASDIMRRIEYLPPHEQSHQGIKSIMWTIITLFFFLFVLILHQRWEKEKNHTHIAFVLLVVLCNLIGIAVMSSFIIFIKGV